MSMTMLIVWGVILTIVIVATAAKIIYDNSSRSIKNHLKKLGKVKGKSYDEIVYVLGNPDSTVRVSGNKIVKKWVSKGYELSLTFNQKNICTGMTEVD